MPWQLQPDGTWTVRGYHDVMVALRDTRLAAASGGTADRLRYPSLDAAPELRRATLSLWQDLALGEVELVSTVCRSFGATAAGMVLGMTDATVRALLPLAEVVWRESAMATSSAISSSARTATALLATAFNDQASTHVQAFVALTHSLPALVSNVMVHSLSVQPEWPSADEESLLRGSSRAVLDEWLRCCAPVRQVYRQVAQRFTVNGDTLEPDTSVTLDIESANFDPSVFQEPGLLRPGARRAAHLAFGVAPHACRGATTVQVTLFAFLSAWSVLKQTHRLTLLRAEPEAHFVAMRTWKRVLVRVEVT